MLVITDMMAPKDDNGCEDGADRCTMNTRIMMDDDDELLLCPPPLTVHLTDDLPKIWLSCSACQTVLRLCHLMLGAEMHLWPISALRPVEE